MAEKKDWRETMGAPFEESENPEYNVSGIRKTTTDTQAHADMLNGIVQGLIDNTAAVKKIAESKAAGTPEFEEAETLGNIQSGDTMPGILGKLKKWYASLHQVAWSGKYGDLENIPSAFTPASHTHDGRYYTESEMDTALAGKSDTNHTHTAVQVGAAASNHTHNYAPIASPVFTGTISLGRKSGTTVGGNSVALGSNATASGGSAVSLGDGNAATANCSYAEGQWTVASGLISHAEGFQTKAEGAQSHAEGGNTKATATNAHAEGSATVASGYAAHAEGGHFDGEAGSTATGHAAHAEGIGTQASGSGSHAEGNRVIASGDYSHAEGKGTKALGTHSHAAGDCTVTEYWAETVVGRYNTKRSPSAYNLLGDFFVVGKGTDENARANAFRVDRHGVYGTAAFNASGADYAELFEWADGNPQREDRAGHFVTLDGEKIRIATPDDEYILGIVSGNPSVVGDVYDDQWAGMFETDIFGRPVWEDVDLPAETMEEPDPEHPGQTITREIIPARTEHRQKVNPKYDHTQKYIPRTERPEWDAVGLLGKLVAVDDGSCQVNGWCKVGEGGIAVHSEQRTPYRVMARLDDTHIRVLILPS